MFRAIGLFFSMFSRLFIVGDKGLQALEKLADVSLAMADSYHQEQLLEAEQRQKKIAELRAQMAQKQLSAPKKK